MNIRRQLILDKHLNGVDYTNGHELNSAIIAAMEEYKDEVINKNDSIHIVSVPEGTVCPHCSGTGKHPGYTDGSCDCYYCNGSGQTAR